MHPTSDESRAPRSVLESLAARTGRLSKVLLSDPDSVHDPAPIVAPGSPAARPIPLGRGNYQIAGEIARGGMAVILKGHDTDLGRDVALKVLDRELAQDPAVVQRFVEEAQIGGQLQHPGIVPVYELGLMADACPYFTMKLVKGRTLLALLQQRPSPADERGRLLAIFESVCQTVAYAHSKGVLHRDLKPANVMLGAFGEVQVVDWGLAKVLQRGGIADEKRALEESRTLIATVRSAPGSSSSHSLVGSVMGTPAYMAPEQAQGEVEKLDERADVFSLGAILCELLTGRPPYVEREAGEALVSMAARAELDPARARLAACEADPALVRLCLECLAPARAARPANAEVVARAVRAFLTSVEERVQKAELAAVEARIKATEERRARRLTLALAGTIVTALALGVGGYAWIEQERGKRAAEMRAAVAAAQGESIELGRAGKHEDALAAARRALARAESGGAEEAELERARGFVARAELALSTVEHERELVAQDEALVRRLVELRLAQIAAIGIPPREQELDRDFAQAFHDYGVDLEGADLVPALQRIRERRISEDVALALDDWARVRRHVHGAKSEKAENLLYLAMDLDPDPDRLRLRQAIFDNDREAMLALAAPGHLFELAPGSIWVLSATLWDAFPEHRPDVYAMYDQALHLYPDDFVIQSIGGNIYEEAGRHEAALVRRAAALGLRPRDRALRLGLAQYLYFLGRMTEAEGALRAFLASDPESAEAHHTLGLTLLALGDYLGCLASLTRSLELEDEPTRRPDLEAARFFTGRIGRDEIAGLLASEPLPDRYLTYLYALLDHPDPAERDPELVLRTLAERPQAAGQAWFWVIQTLAHVRSEDWPGALAAIEGHYQPPPYLVMTPNAFDFLRALIHARLGREGEARESYARGMAEWTELTGGNPAAWERSDVMRWRREAEEALGF